MLNKTLIFSFIVLLTVLLISCEDKGIEGRYTDTQLTPASNPINEVSKPNYAYQISGEVQDIYGQPISGVKVTLGDVSTTTLNDGRYVIIPNTSSNTGIINFTHNEYATQIKNVSLDGKSPRTVLATMKKWDAKETLINGKRNIIITDNVKIDFPKNVKFIKNNAQITGNPSINVCSIDPSIKAQRKAFPGDFSGRRSDGTFTPVESVGLFSLKLLNNGENVNIDPSTPVEVTFDVPSGITANVGDLIPLWWFNEEIGLWIEEGTALVERDSHNNLIARGNVSHFTWWNCDIPSTTSCIKGRIILPPNTNIPMSAIAIEADGVNYYSTSEAIPDNDGYFCLNVEAGAQFTLSVYSYVYVVNGANFRLELSPTIATAYNPGTAPTALMSCDSNGQSWSYATYVANFAQWQSSPCLDIGNLDLVETPTNLNPPPPPPPPPPSNCISGTIIFPTNLVFSTGAVKLVHRNNQSTAYGPINPAGDFCINVPQNGAYDLSIEVYDVQMGNYLISLEIENPNVVVANGNPNKTCQDVPIDCNDIGIISISQLILSSNCQPRITGTVVNSSNGVAIPDATVSLVNVLSSQVLYTSTSSATFTFQNFPLDNYNLNISAPGYSTVVMPISVSFCATYNIGDFPLSLDDLSAGDMRVVLKWGSTPNDLDLHMVFPDPNNYGGCSGSRGHVYFSQRGLIASTPYIELDHDDTSSYGPETITIKDAAFNTTGLGVFKVSVHDFTNNSNQSSTVMANDSLAKIFVYGVNGFVTMIDINANATSASIGNLWKVLEIDPVTRAVTAVNIVESGQSGISNNCASFDW